MRLLIGALAALLLAGCATHNANLMGEDLYVRSCAVCHDVDGDGGVGLYIGPGSNTDVNLTDEQIAGVISVGPGNMPGFPRLTPEQISSLVVYVRSLSD